MLVDMALPDAPKPDHPAVEREHRQPCARPDPWSYGVPKQRAVTHLRCPIEPFPEPSQLAFSRGVPALVKLRSNAMSYI